MPDTPTMILKFGGSVLLHERRLRLAVHEIYRWRREGWRVVAVVSALAGRTDELLEACDRVSPGASGHVVASVVANGEAEAAALLGLQLDRIGLPARVLTPAAVGFIADGSPCDAQPASINTDLIHDALETDGVVVFPGFSAVDTKGRAVTLGRGGSDSTAIFLGHALNADRCRLVKDVDGLYVADPSVPGPRPDRYQQCSYDDALATDGSIIQHKAIRLAASCGLTFELGRFNAINPSVIGSGESMVLHTADVSQPLRVGVAGTGTVGGGVLDLLSELPEFFEVTGVSCRNDERRFELQQQGHTVAVAPTELGSDCDVVIEAIGGIDLPKDVILNAFASGCDVITANKAVVAHSGGELEAAAERYNRRLLYSASVGGGLPAIERTCDGSATHVRGVLNGTSNYVLELVRSGTPVDEAVKLAQDAGFAELNPSRDLDGRDSLDKLVILARLLGFGGSIETSVQAANVLDAPNAANSDQPIRQVATLSRSGAVVELQYLEASDALFDLPGEFNALVIEHEDGSAEIVRGKGAGRWPTAESVLADLLQLSRERSQLAICPKCTNKSQEVCHAT